MNKKSTRTCLMLYLNRKLFIYWGIPCYQLNNGSCYHSRYELNYFNIITKIVCTKKLVM